MKNRLSEIEERLQSFVEGSVSIFPWGQRQDQVAPLLMSALRSSLVQNDQGELNAPSLLTIFVHPHSLPEWQRNQGGLDALTRILQDACQEAGIRFLQPPVLRLATSYDLGENDLRIHAAFPAEEKLTQTTTVAAPASTLTETPTEPINAYIVIEGSQIYPLQLGVINLGRRADNHIVFQDARVSRLHAQLRKVRQNYVLFDLNSAGGTFVNGQKITQMILKPGDVISLAGVTLVYGEDTPQSGHSTKHPTEDIKLIS